jgi:hypothetical protein
MNLHANAALSLNRRRLLCRRVVDERWTVTKAAEAAEVSVRCACKWVGRYRAEGDLGLLDRSSAPCSIASRRRLRRGARAVQRLLAADPQTSKLIACSTKIGAKPRKAIYVSADKDSILLGLAMPRTTRLTTLSSEIADDFRYAIERNDALRKALNERMEIGLKAARDTARAKLALTSGSETDES